VTDHRLPFVFSADQAYAAGWTPDRLRGAMARGDIARIGRGAFAAAKTVASCQATPDGQLRLASAAATLITRRLSWASHESGLALHHIPTGRHVPRRPVVTVDDKCGVVHRRKAYDLWAAQLPSWHRTEVAGIRAVTAARGVVDRCRHVSFVDRLIVGDAVLRLERATRDQVREALDYCAGWPGIRGARSAAAYFDGKRASPLESLSFGVFVLHGLPLPECQVPIVDDWGDLMGIVDFYWREHGVIGEADGRVKYRRRPDGQPPRPTTLLDEKYRQELLEERAIVVRWGWSDAVTADGAPLAQRIRNAFVRAARRRD
jgi:hypothetical protein